MMTLGRRPKAKTKTDLLRHAQRRLKLRHGIDASLEEILALNSQLRYDGAITFGKESSTRTWVAVTIHGKLVPAVFNRKVGCICTFLKHEWVTPERLDLLRSSTIEGMNLALEWARQREGGKP